MCIFLHSLVLLWKDPVTLYPSARTVTWENSTGISHFWQLPVVWPSLRDSTYSRGVLPYWAGSWLSFWSLRQLCWILMLIGDRKKRLLSCSEPRLRTQIIYGKRRFTLKRMMESAVSNHRARLDRLKRFRGCSRNKQRCNMKQKIWNLAKFDT